MSDIDRTDHAAALRALPSVDELARQIRASVGLEEPPSPVAAVAAARAVLAERRAELLAGADGEADLVERARVRLAPGLRRVLNGSGVVIHTNLGRAPLAEAAVHAVEEAARSYVNLELDIASGRRGRRASAIVAALCDLTGAEDALIVNNGAAAALLAASALAGPDRAIAVSRGELIEIGGGFRVPEVVAQSGARLVEVGTTNRTRLSDYQAALAAGADVVLHVHQSNFRAVGFVERVEIESLCALGAPVIDDVGSGALVDIAELADEPQVARSVAAGAAVVCFSGDKLLGGPQAGVMVGTDSAIGACRRHPLARALRAGRLTLSALEATLALYRDPERALREIPVLAMLTADEAELRRRADQFAAAVGGSVVEASARVGGGALPLLELRGPAVALETDEEPGRVAAALRAADPPLIGRIAAGRVLIDPRTLQDDELELAATVTREALRRRS